MSTTSSAYICRVLDFSKDAQAIGRRRYEVFAQRLKWVTGDPTTRLELDELDETATHIGAFDSAGTFVGYVRIIRGGTSGGMLLQKPAFAQLMPDRLDTSVKTAEISRLCVRLSEANSPQLEELLLTMYRAIFTFVVRPAAHTPKPIVRLYATVNNRNAGYMNAERLWRIGFATLAGPIQLDDHSEVETSLLGLDLRQAMRNPQFRAMLGLNR